MSGSKEVSQLQKANADSANIIRFEIKAEFIEQIRQIN